LELINMQLWFGDIITEDKEKFETIWEKIPKNKNKHQIDEERGNTTIVALFYNNNMMWWKIILNNIPVKIWWPPLRQTVEEKGVWKIGKIGIEMRGWMGHLDDKFGNNGVNYRIWTMIRWSDLNGANVEQIRKLLTKNNCQLITIIELSWAKIRYWMT
jgi:hypothetical protein